MTSLVLIRKAAEATGYTEKAIRRKIEEGTWRQGLEYVKAPDNHILIDLKAVEQWARSKAPQNPRKNPQGNPQRG